ncbi:MAG: hypothetical protein ACFB9M_20120 [Myxococcota bacterium]
MWLIDNSFIGNWETLDATSRIRVVSAIDAGLGVRLCWETIREALNVGPRQELLLGRARLLHAASVQAPFRDAWEILFSELRGSPDPSWSSADHLRFREGMAGLARGGAPGRSVTEIPSEIRAEKEKSLKGYKELKAKFSKPSLQKPWDSKVSFDEFVGTWWKAHADTITKFYRDRDPSIRFGVRDVLADPNSFPFAWAWPMAEPALMYRHAAQRRKVHEGDYFDTLRLVYLAGVDGLVTDDKGLTELVLLVWGDRKTVINTPEFVRKAGVQTLPEEPAQ